MRQQRRRLRVLPVLAAAALTLALLVGISLGSQTAARAAPLPNGEFDYTQALQDSMFFYR